MTPTRPSPDGLALACDAEGRVLEVLDDRLGLAGRFPTGRLFGACLAPDSVAKGLSFLLEVRTRQASFEWELRTAGDDAPPRTLCFDGCMADGRLVIVAAVTGRDLLAFLEQLTGSRHGQINWARVALQEMTLKEATAGRFHHDVFNQLTRLNNELANTHRELAKQNSELERLARLKNQFLGMAAHDLRKPAGLVLSYTEILLENPAGSLNRAQLRLLETIQTHAGRMSMLIDDFLDVSMIEAGHWNLDMEVVELAELVAAARELVSRAAARRRIRIEMELDPAARRLRVDGPKLEQVLTNLLSNAVEYSSPDGSVVVGSQLEAGQVRLWIADQGKGIPIEQQQRLFQAFATDRERKPAGGRGIGLGLIIARTIVEAHAGQVFVKSSPGQGSVFGFTLPKECVASMSEELK